MKQSFYDWCIESGKDYLLAEWDYEKNNDIEPRDLGYGSVKKIWWICEKGHSYDAQPNNRKNGSGCPYCKHQKLKTGYNDLLSQRPRVAEFWNYEKNTLTPDKVLAGGHKKVWWKCEKGHEWESTINSKLADHHCPYCSGRLVIKAETDLETIYPEIAAEWNYHKNEGKKPSDISAKSSNKVWWKCKKCGYEWKALISNRTRDDGDTGSGCPQCSKELRISFPEKSLYFYLKRNFDKALENIGNSYFDWLGKMSLDVYVPELKLGIEYDGAWHKKETDLRKNKLCKDNGITLIRIRDRRLPDLKDTSIDFPVENRKEADMRSAIKFIFDYINTTYDCRIEMDIDIKRDRSLIYEAMDLQTKENSLAQVNPQLTLEWNRVKNGRLQPSVVTANSQKKVWWVCKNGHEWQATVASRNFGNGCPICANKTPQVRHDSLDTEHPQLIELWHPTKNLPLTPKDITAGSRKQVWWQCPTCMYEWRSTIATKLKVKGCPVCSKKNKVRDRKSNNLLIEGKIDGKYTLLEKEWHPTKNENLTLYEPTLNIYEKVWWQCNICYYEWQTTIEKRANRGQGCPACKGKAVNVGYNDLSTTNPKLVKEWHPIRNGELKPTDTTKGSAKKVWWLCSTCGHEWGATIKSRNKGSGCPICANNRKKK